MTNVDTAELAPRRDYALTHPLADATTDIAPYRAVKTERDGNLLVSILAVDR